MDENYYLFIIGKSTTDFYKEDDLEHYDEVGVLWNWESGCVSYLVGAIPIDEDKL